MRNPAESSAGIQSHDNDVANDNNGPEPGSSEWSRRIWSKAQPSASNLQTLLKICFENTGPDWQWARDLVKQWQAAGVTPEAKPSVGKGKSAGKDRALKFTEIVGRLQHVHQTCQGKRRRGMETGAWVYLRSKGLDPAIMPDSVGCVPYIIPPYGALVGLATDDQGDIMLAEAVVLYQDGDLCKRFGDGTGKIKYPADKSKKWFKSAAVRMPARDGSTDGPLVLAEGITTALAIWQSTGYETWAVLGTKRFSLVPTPPERDLILAVDADDQDSPGYHDLAKCLADLMERRSLKVARPDGSDGFDFCDLLRERGAEAVRATIEAAEEVEQRNEPCEDDELAGKLIVSAIDHLGRARMFKEARRKNLRHYRDDYLDHQGGRYVPVDDKTIKSEVYDYLDDAWCYNKKGILVPFCPQLKSVAETTSALQAITHVVPTRDQPFWLDGRAEPPPPDLISFPNGILNLRNGEFTPPDPMLFTPHAVGFDYDRDAPLPKNWLKFLNQIYGGEQDQINGLQEMFGYCLSPDVSQEKSFCWIGPKRSGKDTKKNMLCMLLPANAVCGPTLGGLGAVPFGMTPLLHKQLAIIGDMRLGSKCDKDLLAENLLKLTGRGLFTIPRKFKSDWHGRLNCKLLMISNERPSIPDVSGAVASRQIMFTTRMSFYGKEDPDLFEKVLRPEAPGVLRWAVDGLQKMREHGRLHEPACSVQERTSLERLGSPALAFAKDCLEYDPNAEVTLAEMHTVYEDWCANCGMRATSKNWFVRNLKSASGERVRECDLTVDGKKVGGLRGARIANRPPKRARTAGGLDGEIPF